ncbi:hypothetical protein CJF31_00000288 [Rutstroemia sp. NJR-2017a BVV2]|nr:hypothetical protein CJF31_00000288 [Rutstroemia sp. NJR-2017a BVV2]
MATSRNSMERPSRRQERDVIDLLTNGFFRTARGRSPSPEPTPLEHDAHAFLRTTNRDVGRQRSRSRVSRRGPPPPRPIVEDEASSLAREFSTSPSSVSSYDPPSRGTIDQYPIILESDVSEAEAERLHAEPRPKEAHDTDDNDNPERRFVLVPGSEPDAASEASTNRSNDRSEQGKRGGKRPDVPRNHRHGDAEGPSADSHSKAKLEREQDKHGSTRPETTRKPSNDGPALKPPPLERKRSRQDLPNLQTKVPREIPPQFRRSASSFALGDRDETPKAVPQTSTSEYFLSPDTVHAPRPPSRDSTASMPQSNSRQYASQESRRGRPKAEKRNSGSSLHNISRPTTPVSGKRENGIPDTPSRSRRNTNDKMARPQQLASEDVRRTDRHRSNQAERARSPRRSATSNLQYYSSSEDDLADSGSERGPERVRHRHHRTKDLRAEEDYERQVDSPRSNKSSLQSRFSSPLPSPKLSPSQLPRAEPLDRSETFPQGRRPTSISRPISPISASQETPRADRLNPLSPGIPPRPSSRQSNANAPVTLPPIIAPVPHSAPPTKVDFYLPGDPRHSPALPRFNDDRNLDLRAPPNDNSYWQPPAFQPPNTEMPVGSYRRFSEDVDRGSVPALPSCPRMNPTPGRNDWLTLPGCPNFDICPSCFHSIIAPTAFRDHFQPAIRRLDIPIICDFGSSPWYRIAWLLTLKEKRKDLNLFYGLANVAQHEKPCYRQRESIRSWSSIIDPKTGTLVKNFDVCSSCVKSIEILLPAIRGVFIRTDPGYSSAGPRICDLRFDSKRFVQYFDALETTADDAAFHDAAPDTRALAKLARKFSLLEECQQSTDLPDRRWYIITQLPDFTVCEECFDDVVYPELEDRKAIPLMFNKTPQRISKASCQLYSERMRAIFQKAVNTDDYKLLAVKARERKAKEREWKVHVAATKRQSRESMIPNPGLAREIQRLDDEWRRWE